MRFAQVEFELVVVVARRGGLAGDQRSGHRSRFVARRRRASRTAIDRRHRSAGRAARAAGWFRASTRWRTAAVAVGGKRSPCPAAGRLRFEGRGWRREHAAAPQRSHGMPPSQCGIAAVSSRIVGGTSACARIASRIPARRAELWFGSGAGGAAAKSPSACAAGTRTPRRPPLCAMSAGSTLSGVVGVVVQVKVLRAVLSATPTRRRPAPAG